MLNNANNLTIDNYSVGVQILLGNGNGDLVVDWSAGGNTIALGNGLGEAGGNLHPTP